MALARWQASILNQAGDIQPAAQITVTHEAAGSPLATLYADRDGDVPLGNPFFADSGGYAFFHAAGGAYRIVATLGSFTRTWRYVAVGTAAESDFILGLPEPLTADRTYYVRTDGSDANTGLANTSGGAFLTIQRAMDIIAASLDLGPYNVTVQIGNGTYAGGLVLKTYRATSGVVRFTGNTGSPSSCVISSMGEGIETAAGIFAHFNLSGLKLTAASRGIIVDGRGASVNMSSIDFGTTHTHALARYGARLTLTGTNYVSGNATVGFWASRQGLLYASGSTLHYLSGVAYSARNFNASEAGWLDCFSMTFAGSAASVTGKRYEIAGLGGVFTNGGGANYIPGNSAGSVATGGVYY